MPHVLSLELTVRASCVHSAKILFGGVELGPHLTQCRLGLGRNLPTKWHLDPSSKVYPCVVTNSLFCSVMVYYYHVVVRYWRGWSEMQMICMVQLMQTATPSSLAPVKSRNGLPFWCRHTHRPIVLLKGR